MKKQLLSLSLMACMALFAACGSSTDETSTEESSTAPTEEVVAEEMP